MKRIDKLGQMKLSFGMIFSIILIIVFLGFTFFAIRTLMNINNAVTIGKFYDSLQEDIDKAWKASQGSQEEVYSLPQKVKKVCFIDYINSNSGGGGDSELYEKLRLGYHLDENVIFFPLGSGGELSSMNIKHIDIIKMTQEDNPLCFDNIKGKITLNIEKEYGAQLAIIN